MKHYIITNREVLHDEQGEYIREDGLDAAGDRLRFGLFDTANFSQHKNGRQSVSLFPDLVFPDGPTAHPLNFIGTDTNSLKGSQRFFAELYNHMQSQGGGDVLLFIHGRHTSFMEALESICIMEKRYVNPKSPVKHIVGFTWPALGSSLRYRDETRDAELSGYPLARCYLMLIDFFKAIFGADPLRPLSRPCGHNIHLLAHSMGSRVVESMLAELHRRQAEHVTALFREVILAAPDIDWQVFEEPRALYHLVNICNRVSVYFNTKDIALLVSETSKNALNRLGKFGFRDYNKCPAHIYSVDCTGVNHEEGLGSRLIEHWYYKESMKVVNDITEVLKGRNVEDFVPILRTSIPGNAAQYRLRLK